MQFAFDPTITVSLVMSVAVMVFTWFRTRRQDVDERFKAGSDRMRALEGRTAALEQTVDSMPGKDELHRIELHMERMTGEMKAMSASQRGTNDILRRLESIVSRHEDHLLENGKR